MLPKSAISAFPGLNGLRAIAAYCVLMFHSFQISSFYESKWADLFAKFSYLGKGALTLFFVLSGFLITYLLMQEQEKHGKIALGAFYKRRSLRIFPLYYLMVLISALFLFFASHFIPPLFQPMQPILTFSLFLFFFPNIALQIDYPLFAASHLWSLGAETQFYLTWPLLIIKFKKHMFFMIVSVILLKWSLTYLIMPLILKQGFNSSFLRILNLYLPAFPLESMAMGGVGAWCIFNKKERILNLLFHPLTQTVAYLCTGWYIYNNFSQNPATASPILLAFIFSFLMPLIYLVIILNVSCNPRTFFKLENKVLNHLGNISYGLYVFHPLVIFMLIWTYKYYFEIPLNVVVISLATAIITTIIGSLSFYYYESPFLRISKRGFKKSAYLPPTPIAEGG